MATQCVYTAGSGGRVSHRRSRIPVMPIERLTRRIHELEEENRRLRTALVAVSAAVGVGLGLDDEGVVGGQQYPPTLVREDRVHSDRVGDGRHLDVGHGRQDEPSGPAASSF